MQKVSKQSLAMLALSILLAISIALTFTFAVAQDTKTATGTITFSGQAALVINGFAGTEDAGTFSITIGQDGAISYLGAEGKDALNKMSFGLTAESMPAYVKVVLSVEGGNVSTDAGDNKAVTVTLKKPTEFNTPSENAMTTTGAQAANKTWTLDQVIDVAVDLTNYAYETNGTSKITLTISASTASADLA